MKRQRSFVTLIVHGVSLALSFGAASILSHTLTSRIGLTSIPPLEKDASFFLDALTHTPKASLGQLGIALYVLTVAVFLRPMLSAMWIRGLHVEGFRQLLLSPSQLVRSCAVDIVFTFAAVCIVVVGLFGVSLCEFIGSYPDPRPVAIAQGTCLGATALLLVALYALRDLSMGVVAIGRDATVLSAISAAIQFTKLRRRWLLFILLSLCGLIASIAAVASSAATPHLLGASLCQALMLLAAALRATWLWGMFQFQDAAHLKHAI